MLTRVYQAGKAHARDVPRLSIDAVKMPDRLCCLREVICQEAACGTSTQFSITCAVLLRCAIDYWHRGFVVCEVTWSRTSCRSKKLYK